MPCLKAKQLKKSANAPIAIFLIPNPLHFVEGKRPNNIFAVNVGVKFQEQPSVVPVAAQRLNLLAS
jgi:hypothetical protein